MNANVTVTLFVSILHCWLLFLQGRPKEGPEDKFRLTPVVPRLEQLLGGAKVLSLQTSILRQQ